MIVFFGVESAPKLSSIFNTDGAGTFTTYVVLDMHLKSMLD